MKRKGYLFEKVIDEENIRLAIRKAAKGKRGRKTVEWCLENEDVVVDDICDMLVNRTFVPSQPTVKVIYDEHRNKERTIACPRFYPDQIVHHALIQVLIPVILPSMCPHSYGSIPGKGQHKAVHKVEKYIRTGKGYKYAAQFDIEKCYKSIRPDVVKDALEWKIKDKRFINSIMLIVYSYYDGLAIGFYTSQWLMNLVLTRLDHLISSYGFKLIRFADDILILSNNKRNLHRIGGVISAWLVQHGMHLKKNRQIYRISNKRPINFLGFIIRKNKTCLRSNTFLRITRKARKISKRNPTLYDARSFLSYLGIFNHFDCENMLNKYIYPFVSINQLKRKIRGHDYYDYVKSSLRCA